MLYIVVLFVDHVMPSHLLSGEKGGSHASSSKAVRLVQHLLRAIARLTRADVIKYLADSFVESEIKVLDFKPNPWILEVPRRIDVELQHRVQRVVGDLSFDEFTELGLFIWTSISFEHITQVARDIPRLQRMQASPTRAQSLG